MKTYYNVNVGISKRTGSSRCIIEKVDKEKVKCNKRWTNAMCISEG